MTTAERIVSLFGGTRKLAKAAAVPASTVQSWKKAGFIPARRQSAVLDAAKKAGLALGPADFFDEGEAA